MTIQLINAMTAAIDDMKKWPAKTVQLFHHNDADGLSSGRAQFWSYFKSRL